MGRVAAVSRTGGLIPRRPAIPYARAGEAIKSPGKSAVNEIIAKRMNKKPQMRWNRATVQPFAALRMLGRLRGEAP